MLPSLSKSSTTPERDRDPVRYVSPFLKIPSAHITNHELLNEIGMSGYPVIMSTGMSTWEMIDDAVEVLDAAHEQLIEHQAQIGATIRRFDFTISNLESMVLQTENNRNSLTALDEAREITDMSINQIKQQTALAMMAQAQSLSHAIFQLLQNH